MKFSKSDIKNIIQEELDNVLAESARRRALGSVLMKILKIGPEAYAKGLAKNAKRNDYDIKKDPGAALTTLATFAQKDFAKAYRNNGCPSVEREERPGYDKDLLKCKALKAANEDLNNNIILGVSDESVKAAKRLMAFIPTRANYAKSKYMSVMTTRVYSVLYKKFKKGTDTDL
jgi:hypothetical protein